MIDLEQFFSRLDQYVRGFVRGADYNDGWLEVSDTWTYASATSFTVPCDRTEMFTVAAKLRWTQTTLKQDMVASVVYAQGITTVTITGTISTISNAAMDNPGISYAATPQGYPNSLPGMPSAHGSTHISTGSDAIANAVAGGASGLMTGADKTKLDGIETAADVTDAANVGAAIRGATAKTTPVDADTMPLIDSAAGNALKKVTWANIKATLKTYFDTLYALATHSHTSVKSPSTTGVIQFSGMTAGTTRQKTVRDANDTLLELGGSHTPTGTWSWASATVTWPSTLVLASLYDANTILTANSDNTPAALTVAEQRILGRKTGGSIAALSASEILGIIGERIYLMVVANGTTPVVGDGAMRFTVPEALIGLKILKVDIAIYTVSTSGTTYVQIYNQTDSVDVLTTRPVIDAGEYNSYTGTRSVVNTSNNTLATGDILRVDVDAVGTSVKGLDVIIEVGI